MNAFDALLVAISPWQNRVSPDIAEKFESLRLHCNLDFLEGSQRNPLQALAALVMDEKLGCSLESEALARMTGIDPEIFETGTDCTTLEDSDLHRAAGVLALAMLRTWRNQVRENLLLPIMGASDPLEPVAS